MEKHQGVESARRYVPSLEGIRGYGVLLVFIAHYCLPGELGNHHPILYFSVMGLRAVAFVAVPVFFALSGYLIGGILYHTRNREGYFKVFYTRRILRVFPVYYLTLIAIACIDKFLAFPLDHRFWAHFLYIQNLFPSMTRGSYENPIAMGHFWSLAVEEQFYLLWPLVVWLFPERRKLIWVTSLLVCLCCVLRFAAPWLSLTPRQVLYFTPTRADAIPLGVLLALIDLRAMSTRIRALAKWFVVAGVVFVIVGAFWTRETILSTFNGIAIVLPIVNCTAVATIAAVMEEGSWINRLCSYRWVCWLGARSYSLYIFHYLFSAWYLSTLIPRLERYMRHSLAFGLSVAIVSVLCVLLSMLSYRFIEGPAMMVKGRFRYGGIRKPDTPQEARQPALAESGG